MTTLASNTVTFADYTKRVNSDGTMLPIVEILNVTNELTPVVPWMQCNDGHEHRTLLRTALPTVTEIQPGGGFALSASDATPVVETCSILGTAMQVDALVAKSYGDEASLLAGEAVAAVEAMNQTFVDRFFYGNQTTNKLQFNGLNARYASTSAANNGENVLLGGGAGSDNTSVWGLVLGESTLHGIYPKGLEMGLSMIKENDGKEVMRTLSNGNIQPVKSTRFQWHCGLALRDWRAAVRIANIDTSNLLANSTPADLYTLLIKAYHRMVPVMNRGKAVFVVNRGVMQALDIQSREDAAYRLDYTNIDGKMVTQFRGIPFIVTDALRKNEATIS